jgi:hypothetical protein
MNCKSEVRLFNQISQKAISGRKAISGQKAISGRKATSTLAKNFWPKSYFCECSLPK